MDFKTLVQSKGSMKKIIPVPYISQYSKGFDESWRVRSCGVACVAMCLGYYNLEDIKPMSLIDEGVAIGGYCDKGWFHDALVKILRNHHVNAYSQEFRSVEVNPTTKTFKVNKIEEKFMEDGLAKIISEVDDGHPVIVSVEPGFNTNNESHLVLIIGYDFTNQQEKLIIHDPEGQDGSTAQEEMPVDIARFRKFWRKFAIFSYL